MSADCGMGLTSKNLAGSAGSVVAHCWPEPPGHDPLEDTSRLLAILPTVTRHTRQPDTGRILKRKMLEEMRLRHFACVG
jgi:hypothetical protein